MFFFAIIIAVVMSTAPCFAPPSFLDSTSSQLPPFNSKITINDHYPFSSSFTHPTGDPRLLPELNLNTRGFKKKIFNAREGGSWCHRQKTEGIRKSIFLSSQPIRSHRSICEDSKSGTLRTAVGQQTGHLGHQDNLRLNLGQRVDECGGNSNNSLSSTLNPNAEAFYPVRVENEITNPITEKLNKNETTSDESTNDRTPSTTVNSHGTFNASCSISIDARINSNDQESFLIPNDLIPNDLIENDWTFKWNQMMNQVIRTPSENTETTPLLSAETPVLYGTAPGQGRDEKNGSFHFSDSSIWSEGQRYSDHLRLENSGSGVQLFVENLSNNNNMRTLPDIGSRPTVSETELSSPNHRKDIINNTTKNTTNNRIQKNQIKPSSLTKINQSCNNVIRNTSQPKNLQIPNHSIRNPSFPNHPAPVLSVDFFDKFYKGAPKKSADDKVYVWPRPIFYGVIDGQFEQLCRQFGDVEKEVTGNKNVNKYENWKCRCCISSMFSISVWNECDSVFPISIIALLFVICCRGAGKKRQRVIFCQICRQFKPRSTRVCR